MLSCSPTTINSRFVQWHRNQGWQPPHQKSYWGQECGRRSQSAWTLPPHPTPKQNILLCHCCWTPLYSSVLQTTFSDSQATTVKLSSGLFSRRPLNSHIGIVKYRQSCHHCMSEEPLFFHLSNWRQIAVTMVISREKILHCTSITSAPLARHRYRTPLSAGRVLHSFEDFYKTDFLKKLTFS